MQITATGQQAIMYSAAAALDPSNAPPCGLHERQYTDMAPTGPGPNPQAQSIDAANDLELITTADHSTAPAQAAVPDSQQAEAKAATADPSETPEPANVGHPNKDSCFQQAQQNINPSKVADPVPATADPSVPANSLPSNPPTLDDIWPAVLATSHRTSSISSGDALLDLYNQYLRQGSGSFPAIRRQDSTLSGGLGGVLNPSGGSMALLQSPRVLATLQSLANTPKGLNLNLGCNIQGLGTSNTTPRGFGFSCTPRGIITTPRGLIRLESLASQGTGGAGFSPGLVSLLSGDPFRTVSIDKGGNEVSHDWLTWPPLNSTAAAAAAEPAPAAPQSLIDIRKDCKQQAADQEQQNQQEDHAALEAAPSVTGWLPADSPPAATAAAAPVGEHHTSLQELQQGVMLCSSAAPSDALVVLQGTAVQPLALQSLPQTRFELYQANNATAPTDAHTSAPCHGVAAAAAAAVAGVPRLLDPDHLMLLPAAAAAAAADTDSPSDEPEQHPYSLMDPAAAAAAAAAARRHRKQVLAELRCKRPQTAHRKRVMRKRGSKEPQLANTMFLSYQPGQADVLSPEERRSLTKVAAALVARQREQHDFLQQQQQHNVVAASTAAGFGGLLRQPPMTLLHMQQRQRQQQQLWQQTLCRPPPPAAAATVSAGTAAAAVGAESSSDDESSSDSSDDESSDLSSDDSADLDSADLARLAAAAAAAASAAGGSSNPVGSQVAAYMNGGSRFHLLQQQQQQQQQQQMHMNPGHWAAAGIIPAVQHTGSSNAFQLDQYGIRRVSSPGMPPLFVPVAATGRHGSGTSDSTALGHQWHSTGAGASNLGLNAAAAGGSGSLNSSTHNSPDQPQQQQQQQQYLVKDGYSRLVVDPKSAKVTVYPRTKRGRKMSQKAAAAADDNVSAEAQPAAAAQQQQQQQPANAHLSASVQLEVQRPELRSKASTEDAPNNSGDYKSQSEKAPQPQLQQQQQEEEIQEQQHQQQQPECTARGSSIALSRPRRQIRPTAAAAAYAADSDFETELDAAAGVKRRNSNSYPSAAGGAAAAATAAVDVSDSGSESAPESNSSESDDVFSSEADDYAPSRRSNKRSRIRRQSSAAAAAAATKRRRSSSGTGSPDGPAAAPGSKRRAAAAAGRGVGSSKRSPDLGSGSAAAAAAAKPVIEDTRSRYRGVTRHRRSGRWEAHIWVKELGRQVYLGGYELEEAAAEAYDMAALKCKGRGCPTNFPYERYADLLDSLDSMSLEELIMAVRRQSQGFSRGSSNYRGVTAHPSGRWESRIGIPGSRHVYLGLFVEEQEAARAYDGALVRLKGTAAATNYSLGCYQQQLAEHYQMKMAVEAGLVHRELFKRHSGQDFEQWIKQGLTAFDIELSTEARDMARADVGNATEGAAGNSSGVIRLASGRVSGDGGGSLGGSPVLQIATVAPKHAAV